MDIVFDNTDKASRIAEWASSHSRRFNLHAALQAHWEQKCSTVKQPPTGSQPADAVPAAVDSQCLKLGFCVCCERGQEVLSMRNIFHRHLKAATSKQDPEARGLLTKGLLCVQLVATAPAPVDSEWLRLLQELDSSYQDEPEGDHLSSGTHWFHIGLMYLKPFRATLQQLQEVGEQQPIITLQQTGVFLTEWEMLATFHPDSKWDMRLWKLKESRAPRAAVEPSLAEVEPFNAEVYPLWPPPRRGRPRGAGSRRSQNTKSRQGGRATDPRQGTVPDPTDLPQPDPEAADLDDASQDSDDLGSEDADDDMDLDALQELLEEFEAPLTEEATATAAASSNLLDEEPITEQVPEDIEDFLRDLGLLDPPASPAEPQGPAASDEAMPSAPMPPPPPSGSADAPVEEAASVASTTRTRAETTCIVPGGLITHYKKGFFHSQLRQPIAWQMRVNAFCQGWTQTCSRSAFRFPHSLAWAVPPARQQRGALGQEHVA